MKRQVLVPVGLFLAVACGSRPEPKDYTPPTGEFRIALPGTPQVSQENPGGFGVETVYKLGDGGNTTYMIRRMDCPAEFAADASGDRLYERFQLDIVDATRTGAVQSQRAVIAGGQGAAGREFVIHGETRTGKPYEMTFRLFRAGGTVYVLNASTPPDDEDARTRATTALDSFAILK